MNLNSAELAEARHYALRAAATRHGRLFKKIAATLWMIGENRKTRRAAVVRQASTRLARLAVK